MRCENELHILFNIDLELRYVTLMSSERSVFLRDERVSNMVQKAYHISWRTLQCNDLRARLLTRSRVSPRGGLAKM